MSHKIMLKHKFNTEIKENAFLFEKINTPHIILYKWNDGFAYRAQYKCIPSNISSLEEICTYVENKFDIDNKRGEFYMFNEHIDLFEVDGVYVRELNYQDNEALEDMKSDCNPDEIELAQIMIHDLHVLGAFIDDRLVGVSSILDLWGTYDIGILVHPYYRRKGISAMLVSHNAKWVLEQGKICMYRCDDFNTGSINTAKKLGFKTEIEVIIYNLKK